MEKKKIFLIYFDEWGSWVLLTFVLSLLLIFLSIFMFSRSIVFSNFLSYCFTLMAITFYLFDHHVETTVDVNVPKIRKILNLIVLVLMAVLYFLANMDLTVKSFFESNFTVMSIITTSVVAGSAAWLMYPLINNQAEQIKGKRESAIIANQRKKFRRMKSNV